MSNKVAYGRNTSAYNGSHLWNILPNYCNNGIIDIQIILNHCSGHGMVLPVVVDLVPSLAGEWICRLF